MEAPDPNTIDSADLVIYLILPSLILIGVILYLVMKHGAVWEPEDED